MPKSLQYAYKYVNIEGMMKPETYSIKHFNLRLGQLATEGSHQLSMLIAGKCSNLKSRLCTVYCVLCTNLVERGNLQNPYVGEVKASCSTTKF